MSNRIDLSQEIAAQVQFLSDRTCCICRTPGRGIQIHHIDGDSLNNDIGNLAVLCLECHDKTLHRGGFTRQLTPDLVKFYNKSWRDIVKRRLLPDDSRDVLGEYKREVYVEISLTCHYWKGEYIVLYPGNFAEKDGKDYLDVWDMMVKTGRHTYSEQEWKRYRPLFDGAIKGVIERLQKLLIMYPDAIAPQFKTHIIRAMRQLETERFAYLQFPTVFCLVDNKDQAFKVRFSEVIRCLSDLIRKADEMRETDFTGKSVNPGDASS